MWKVSGWSIAVWAGAVAYVVVLSIESIADQDAFTTGFDTAVYDQLLWLLANGHEPFSTVVARPMLADHFQPGVVLLTPIYWLGLGLPGLFVAQSIGLALAAPALQALARRAGASATLAAIPALLWLSCPWVASINLFEFRPTAFAPLLLILSVIAARAGRHWLLAITVILGLSLKEDVSLTYVMLGIVLILEGKRRVGSTLALISALWFLGASIIIEALGGSYEAFGARYAGERGDSVTDAVVWSLTHPLETASDAATESLLGLGVLVVSTAGLAVLAPAWLLLAAPTAVYNGLSDYTAQHYLTLHYHQGTLLGLFVAASIGVGKLPSLRGDVRLVLAAAATVAVGLALVAGHQVHSDSGVGIGLDPARTRKLLDRVPPYVPVAASRTLLPHLSQRAEIYTLPEPFHQLDWGSSLSEAELRERAKRVRYVVFAEGDDLRPFPTDEQDSDIPPVRPLLVNAGFVLIAEEGSVEVYARHD